MIELDLYCDVDSTLTHDHRARIQRYTDDKKNISNLAFSKAEVMKDTPAPHSVSVLRELAKHFNIHYLTARGVDTGWDDGESITREWLELHGYPITSITVVNNISEKIAFLKVNKCDLFIDDFTTGQENKKLSIRYDVMEKIPVPFERYRNDWMAVLNKYLFQLPTGEYFYQFMLRNLAWWQESSEFEKRSRGAYYNNFIESLGLSKNAFDDRSIVEIGMGAVGGILHYLYYIGCVNFKSCTYVDIIAKQLRNLKLIKWLPKAKFIECPMEKIELKDNSIDVLISYNALDHGWDIKTALRECMRVAKTCYIAFDCRGSNIPEHIKADYYQEIDYTKLASWLYNYLTHTYPNATGEIRDLRTLSNFQHEHNYGYPIMLFKFEKNS